MHSDVLLCHHATSCILYTQHTHHTHTDNTHTHTLCNVCSKRLPCSKCPLHYFQQSMISHTSSCSKRPVYEIVYEANENDSGDNIFVDLMELRLTIWMFRAKAPAGHCKGWPRAGFICLSC